MWILRDVYIWNNSKQFTLPKLNLYVKYSTTLQLQRESCHFHFHRCLLRECHQTEHIGDVDIGLSRYNNDGIN